MAPPRINTHGFSGLSKTLLRDFSSLSIMRPAALGNTAVKPIIETCALWAAAKASFTKRLAKGARFFTSSVFACSSGVPSLVSAVYVLTFSKTRISPLFKFLIASLAFSPKTSSTYLTGLPRTLLRVSACCFRGIKSGSPFRP